MFDNIGGKIKGLAKFVCWVGIIASVLAGLSIISAADSEFALIGFVVMVVGSLVSWIGSFFSYGLGQLIENSDILVRQGQLKLSRGNAGNAPAAAPVAAPAPAPAAAGVEEKYCTKCGQKQNASRNVCWSCGHPFDN